MEVLGGVLVTRRIAAADVPTAHTQPQVNPAIAHLEALGTAIGLRLYLSDLVRMCALFHVPVHCLNLYSLNCHERPKPPVLHGEGRLFCPPRPQRNPEPVGSQGLGISAQFCRTYKALEYESIRSDSNTIQRMCAEQNLGDAATCMHPATKKSKSTVRSRWPDDCNNSVILPLNTRRPAFEPEANF